MIKIKFKAYFLYQGMFGILTIQMFKLDNAKTVIKTLNKARVNPCVAFDDPKT